MPYGQIKVDEITFTNAGVDQTISVSGVVASISGNITATGTISGDVIRGGTLVSGATVTGTAGQFGTITGNTAAFTTVTGTTVTGTTATFTSGVFTNISGGTHTVTSGVFASGTAANPSITFQGDVNTGIYSPGADQVAVATNGTQRITVDGSGNVNFDSGTVFVDANSNRLGVGTVTATSALNVATANTGAGQITAECSTFNTNDVFGYDFKVTGNNLQAFARAVVTNGSTAATALTFGTATGGNNATERLRITDTGLVGIGTTAPSYALDVRTTGTSISSSFTSDQSEQYIALKDSGTTIGHVRLGSTSGSMLFFAGNGERGRFDSSGRLLVGTSSNDSNALAVVQGYAGLASGQGVLALRLGTTRPASADTGIGSIRFESTSNTSSNYHYASISAFSDGASSSDTDIPGRLVFSTTADGASSPTERMRITNDGNILIGTTNNNGRLVVSADIPSNVGQRCVLFSGIGAGDVGMECLGISKFDNNSTASQIFVRFYMNNGANGSGQINANGSGAVAFGSYSDERLKENIVELPSQYQNIKNLRPVEFDYREGGGHQTGFIAQEMQRVYPDSVSAGSDEMLMLTGWSKTEARLVKALQEAIEKIETLEAKVAALEAA